MVVQFGSGQTAPTLAVAAYGLSRTYVRRPALRGLNLEVSFGETVALLGPNGAGKTTLIRLLASLDRPSSGELRVGGYTLPRQSEAVRHFVGLVSHQTLLYDELSVRENLDFYAALYGVLNRSARVEELLAQVGLAHRHGDRARTLSRGMQQRLSIARALVHDPAILLLDEPETGLDVSAMDMLARVFTSGATGEQRRRTVVMATHSVERALQICDRVLVLDRGRLVLDEPSGGLTPEVLRHVLTGRRALTPDPSPPPGVPSGPGEGSGVRA